LSTSPEAPSFQRWTRRPATDSPSAAPTWSSWPARTALTTDSGPPERPGGPRCVR
jgi:hypothetical protein